MRSVLAALTSPTALILLVAAVLAACFWRFGPLIGWGESYPFESLTARLIGVGLILGGALLWVLLMWRARRRRARALAGGIAAQSRPPEEEDPDPAAEEMAEVGERMREALALLSKVRLGKRRRQRLYELPWYVIIGPPGTGKTTAIVNSGLQFPLADRFGKRALSGVGGTRNCEWWFTNEAVLIDTAGRYTTQDSDADRDARAWTGFLDLLKKTRPRQPLNGVLVAISLSDFSTLDAASRQAHARAIRARLDELQERLGVALPVYVLLTKADLIAGFTEFFDDLGKEERGQVWGFTLEDLAAEPLAAFDQETQALVERLNDRSLERMQAETDPTRRALVAGFSAQLQSLLPVARGFLESVFQDSRFGARPRLRGVYLTSGTQEGTPIDRLMRSMSRAFGIGRQAIGSGKGKGRSYFLTRLLTDVVFREAGLVSADDRVERRHRYTRWGAIAASLLVVAGLGTLWTRSYLGNAQLVSATEDRVLAYQDLVADLQVSPVADVELERVALPLDILRGLPGNPALGDPDPPIRLTFGLYQGDVVGTHAAQTYRSALNRLLLPRLLLRLERQFEANLDNADLLYEGLKVYLMLGLEGPMDEAMVRRWMAADWQIAYPGQGNADLRERLSDHLDALLSQPMTDYGDRLNGPLIERIQERLARTPLAERVYRAIAESPEAEALPEWRPTTAGGPATTRVMIRPSGAPLTEGVAGLYTYEGFHDVFLPAALSVAKRVQREAWVLGPRFQQDLGERALANLTRDVVNLYYTDYIAKWERLLGDLDVVPLDTLGYAVEVTNVLSGPTSPLRGILEGIARETDLTRPRTLSVPTDVAGAQDAVGGAAGQLAENRVQGLSYEARLLVGVLAEAAPIGGGLSRPGEAAPEPGQVVADRFAWLHEFVGGEEGAPSRLDGAISQIEAVYGELNRVSVGGGAAGGLAALAPGEDGAAGRLKAAAARMDDPMKRWAVQIADDTQNIGAADTRAALNRRWQAQVLTACRRTVEGRYPFSRGAGAEVALGDFARLFAPEGLIDAFFNQHLSRFVDTAGRSWQWRPGAGQALGVPDRVLTQFQNAAEIRDAFFLGTARPQVTFSLTPEFLDAAVTRVTLEVDGQALEFAHGPKRATDMVWPGPGGRTRVAVQPQVSGRDNSLSRDGPWAWFRLIDAAGLRRTNVSDRSKLVFDVGGRLAGFELRAGSALNPFSLPALGRFRCLPSL